jgi:hypothetical protein
VTGENECEQVSSSELAEEMNKTAVSFTVEFTLNNEFAVLVSHQTKESQDIMKEASRDSGQATDTVVDSAAAEGKTANSITGVCIERDMNPDHWSPVKMTGEKTSANLKTTHSAREKVEATAAHEQSTSNHYINIDVEKAGKQSQTGESLWLLIALNPGQLDIAARLK